MQNLLLDFFGCFFTYKASQIRILGCRIADAKCFDFCDCLLGKFGTATVMDKESLRCAADLAAIVHASPDHLVNGQIDVAVLKKDKCVVAAELQRYVCQMGGSISIRLDTDFGRTGKCDRVYIRILTKPVANLGAASGYDLDRAGGHSRFSEKCCQHAKRQGIIRGGLHDGGISCQKRRRDFLIEKITREIKRNDAGDNADRLFYSEDKALFLPGFMPVRQNLAVKVLGFFGKSLECDRYISYLASCFANRFSGFLRKSFGKRFLVSFDEIKKFHHDLCLLPDGNFGPNWLSLFGDFYGFCDIGRSGGRYTVDFFSVCGVNNINDGSVRSVDRHAGNKHFHIMFLLRCIIWKIR